MKDPDQLKSVTNITDEYGKASYWDERYFKDKMPYDFLQAYLPKGENSPIRDLIQEHVPAASQILIVGVGSSMMPV